MRGELYVKNKAYNKLAEGVFTARAVMGLAAKYGVDMPLTSAVDMLVRDKIRPDGILYSLFGRDTKAEFN